MQTEQSLALPLDTLPRSGLGVRLPPQPRETLDTLPSPHERVCDAAIVRLESISTVIAAIGLGVGLDLIVVALVRYWGRM